MNRLLWLTLFTLAIAQTTCAQDIVYSSAPLTKRNGAYYPTGTAHLYRMTADGQQTTQLTKDDFDDTDPCLSPDKGHILFLRRDKLDQVGKTWLCSIRLDGSNLVALWRIDDPWVRTPKEILDDKAPGNHLKFDLYTLIENVQETGEDRDTYVETADRTIFRWLDSAKSKCVYQIPVKTPDGSWPVTYLIDASLKKCTGKLRGYALEDVNPTSSECLVSRWQWGSERRYDGAWPLGSLSVWKPATGILPIPFGTASCRGACICPSSAEDWGVRRARSGPRYLTLRAGRLHPPKRVRTGRRSRPANQTGGPIIFSASRYGDRFEVPFETEEAHLYAMLADGSGLKQLTFGDESEAMPSISNDGRHILFWRCDGLEKEYGNDITLYRMNPDGSGIQSLGVDIDGYPKQFEANSVEAFGRQTVTRKYIGGHDRILYHTPSGTMSVRADDYSFSPDGKHLLAGSYRQKDLLIDLATGRIRQLNSSLILTTWLDRHTLVAFKGTYGNLEVHLTEPTHLCFVGLDGRTKLYMRVPKPTGNAIYNVDGGFDLGLTEFLRAFPLGSARRFLWQFHHTMSDGGYDWSFLLSPNVKSTEMQEGTIEAVSPKDDEYLASVWGWVGGYKRHGAEKLCTLEVRNLRTGETTEVGFRRMECYGAVWFTGR